ncbi:hypothetical protein GCM10027088_74030 [Nocardia goodfellowii]
MLGRRVPCEAFEKVHASDAGIHTLLTQQLGGLLKAISRRYIQCCTQRLPGKPQGTHGGDGRDNCRETGPAGPYEHPVHGAPQSVQTGRRSWRRILRRWGLLTRWSPE